jgi:hypothetical protein
MNKDVLDSEFYEKKELSARDWWESKRTTLNKFCAASIGLLFVLSFLFFINDTTLLLGILAILVFFSFFFFAVTNISYSGIWVLEDISKKIFKHRTNEQTRDAIYKMVIFLLFSPNILYLLFIIILKYPLK